MKLRKKLKNQLKKKSKKQSKFQIGIIKIKKLFFLIAFILIIKIGKDKKIFTLNNINDSICFYINEINDLSDFHNSKFYCSKRKFIEISQLNEIENYKNNIDKIILKVKASKIENIIILIGLFPFLNDNSTIYFIAKTRKSYQVIKNLLKESINYKYKIIEINKNNLSFLCNNFNNSLNDNWKLIPSLSLLNNIRYIINNYYSKNSLNIFDSIIHFNLRNYISVKNSTFSYKYLKILMSKCYNIKIKRFFRYL